MIRIRSPTKKKLNRKSISDWKRNTPVAFLCMTGMPSVCGESPRRA